MSDRPPLESFPAPRTWVRRWEDGVVTLLSRTLGWELPRGVGWGHTLGSAALTVLALQAVTGVCLALYYCPSPDAAWESLRYVEEEVWAGALVRGLHSWGASGLVVLLGLHLGRVFVAGAYKSPRRGTWVAGVVLLLLVLGAAFTGYLLPWDLKSYFATKVGVEVASTVPLLGAIQKRMILGGEEIGALTLTRFYALHAIVLPGLLLLFVAGHITLVRRHGITPPEGCDPEEAGAACRFFPDHAWKDAAVSLGVVFLLLGLAGFFGAPLEAKADPAATGYVPRPEWYFLPLFQLLHYFEGPWMPVGTLVLPGLAVVMLLFLPWIDRGPGRRPSERKMVLSAGCLVFTAALGLLTLAVLETPTSGGLQPAEGPAETTREGRHTSSTTARNDASAPAERAAGVPPELTAESAERGRALYDALQCASCHEGTPDDRPGPDLSYAGSRWQRGWTIRYLLNPYRVRWRKRGVRPLKRMPDFHLSEDEAREIADFLSSRQDEGRFPARGDDPDEALVKAGEALFEDCLACHRLAGEDEGDDIGPDLTGVGRKLRRGYLEVFLADPDAVIPGSPMRRLGLEPGEATALAAYLSTLQKVPVESRSR